MDGKLGKTGETIAGMSWIGAHEGSGEEKRWSTDGPVESEDDSQEHR